MDLHNDAVKALEFPPKEDKRVFGDLDEERSTKEEDILGRFWHGGLLMIIVSICV
jgi:hypothetical protein